MLGYTEEQIIDMAHVVQTMNNTIDKNKFPYLHWQMSEVVSLLVGLITEGHVADVR